MNSPPSSAARGAPDAVAEVIVRRGDGTVVARWSLAPGEYALGGSRHNDLRLDERGVSNRHARLRVDAGGVSIQDLGSRYGTRRDGMLIDGPVPVTKSRPVEIGNLVLVAELLEARGIRALPIATLAVDAARAAAAEKKRGRKGRAGWRARAVLAGALALLAVAGGAGGFWKIFASPNRASISTARPELLHAWRGQVGWDDTRLRPLGDGRQSLDLSGLAPGDLSALRELRVSELDLSFCALAALPDLRGCALRRLVLTGNAIRDLTPLRGQPLEELHLDETAVADLAPLAGLLLTTLTLHGTPVTDLSPLAGMPLHALDLRDHRSVRDFRPLLDCRRLTVLAAPAEADLECLRGHPTLRLIALGPAAPPDSGALDGPLPVRVFWEKFGDLLRHRAAEGAP